MTRKPAFTLEELVAIYRTMDSPHWANNRLCGDFKANDQDAANDLQRLLAEENYDDYPSTVLEGDPDAIKVGSKLSVEFGQIKTSVGIVVANIDALLGSIDIASGVRKRQWYVFESDIASWEDSEVARRLATVHRLVAALKSTSAFFDQPTSTLVFLKEGRFDLPVSYLRADLMGFDLDAANALVAEITKDDGHNEQRKEIVATAVIDALSDTPIEARFARLMGEIEKFRVRVIDGYRLFASSFSYEKVRDQAEALSLEYAGRIHKTISDIQGQLLGIPVSTIVVATQLKTADAPGQMWINLAVVAGTIVFCILLALSIWNQLQTLDVIQNEVQRHDAALKKDNADIAGRLGDVFQKQLTRIQFHRIALVSVGVIALIGAMLTGAVFSRL